MCLDRWSVVARMLSLLSLLRGRCPAYSALQKPAPRRCSVAIAAAKRVLRFCQGHRRNTEETDARAFSARGWRIAHLSASLMRFRIPASTLAGPTSQAITKVEVLGWINDAHCPFLGSWADASDCSEIASCALIYPHLSNFYVACTSFCCMPRFCISRRLTRKAR